MIKYKWDNWRLISNYTETQVKRLKNLQTLYADLIKQNHNLTEALVHTFLESDEKGVPIRGVTVEAMNPFERYTDSHPLVSYANMLQTKILKYLLARLENTATYSNDPQSLLCLQMLHDFRECFVKAAITDNLLATVGNWKKFVTRLKVATIPGTKEALFPHHEESKLAYTLQWLLSNVNSLLEQVSEEIQLELSRRSIADYLDNLAHSTKVTIELGFEYIAHILTYEPLPLDFNLANFYDKNIDIDLHKKLHAKTWFQYLYQFASSSAIKDLFFGTKLVHYELQSLMSANSTAPIRIAHEPNNPQPLAMPDSALAGLRKSVFLTQQGEVNAAITKQLYRQPKSTLMAEETGVLALFCQPNQTIYLQTALKFLGHLEIIARLTSLTRVASYLLHQDGSLLARKETKSQIQLFIDIYQTLLNQLFASIETLKKSFDQQLDDNQRYANQPFHCNPNLELCNVLGDKLTTLQKDCKNTLGQIHTQLMNIDQHRRELNELLCWFKQQWFGFMGNYSWLLSSGQQQTVLDLRQGEMKLAKEQSPLALLAATEEKRPILTIGIDNLIDGKALYGLLQYEINAYPQCQGIHLADLMDFQDPAFLRLSINQLAKGQRLFCITATQKNNLALFAILRNQQNNLCAIYIDARGNFALSRGIETYCTKQNISLTKVCEAYQSSNPDDAIHVYENALILLQAQEEEFNADYLWQQIGKQGLNHPQIATIKRYFFAQRIRYWQSMQMNKAYESIVVSQPLEQTTATPLEIIHHPAINQSTLDSLFINFPKLIIHIGTGCMKIMAEDIKYLAATYQERFSLQCISTLNNKPMEIAIGRRYKQLNVLVDRCIRSGVIDEKLWECFFLLRKESDVNDFLATTFHDSGDTFLHLAANQKQPEICEYLIKYGIDKEVKNKQGFTALDVAVTLIKNNDSPQLKGVIKVLLKHQVPASNENLQKAKEYLSLTDIKAPVLGMFK